jgi:hypothetical protein
VLPYACVILSPRSCSDPLQNGAMGSRPSVSTASLLYSWIIQVKRATRLTGLAPFPNEACPLFISLAFITVEPSRSCAADVADAV